MEEKLVCITVSLPQSYRDLLRRMSAEENLKNPERFTSVSQIAREIICEHLERIHPHQASKQEGGIRNDQP